MIKDSGSEGRSGQILFDSITLCLDMCGCPNRCRHCWVGHSPNGALTDADLEWTAAQFRPFAKKLIVYDWYREPDFSDRYRQRWQLCDRLSDGPRDHFELASVWRLARDPDYPRWLVQQGVPLVQLTLFGGEEKTDFYTGRKNAYRELCQAIDILLAHRIGVRLQVFVNQDTLPDLPAVEALIAEKDLEARCAAIGKPFSCFLHQGSCDGENLQWYPRWVTPADLEKIPPRLAEYTLRHYQKERLEQVFGRTERDLFAELAEDHTTRSYVEKEPTFYINKDFEVCPNLSTPGPIWRLGSLKTDGPQAVLEAYLQSESPAQRARLTVPLSQIVRAAGDPDSQRLFSKGDYILYLLTRCCRENG